MLPLSCLHVQAFGTTASRAACKNSAARKVIDSMKKVVEHLNMSNVMKVRYFGGGVGSKRELGFTVGREKEKQ